MEVKCLLFAAFFLVACVVFSSQDELTDVEGKSKINLFFFLISLINYRAFIVSIMFNTKKIETATTIYRKEKRGHEFTFILHQR